MLFFKKKKEPELMTSLGRGFIPTEKVGDLSSKGFTEPEIINVLRKEGHSAEEIDKALTQALKSGVEGPRHEITFTPVAPVKTEGKLALPTIEEALQPKADMPAVPETTLPQEYYYPEQYPTEEYVDYLIKERMTEVEQRISDFSKKSGELERKIGQVYDQLSFLRQGKPSEQQLVLAKLDGIKETVDEVDVRLNSLERAFKETLPALIESVRALSDLVQRFKREA